MSIFHKIQGFVVGITLSSLLALVYEHWPKEGMEAQLSFLILGIVVIVGSIIIELSEYV